MRSESQVEATDVPASPPGASDGERLRPYRNWALQNSVISAITDDSSWGDRPADLGLAETESATLVDARGQAALLRELKPDPKFRRRTITALALWCSALMIDVLNQWGPEGLKLSEGSLRVSLIWLVSSIVFTALVYPPLRARAFTIVDQAMLINAYALITFQCHATGGADSPFMVWWLFATFYAAQFISPRRAYINVFAMTVLALSPIAYDPNVGDGSTPVLLALLITVIWVMAQTLVAGRRFIRKAERAVRFLALADPLTGIANRRSFELALDAAANVDGPKFALIMIDMNGLKGANAAFGYDVGDEMLRRLAHLMRYASDTQTQVARVRGDEFAVLLPGAASDAQAWRDRFETLMSRHNCWIKGRSPQISVTVGVAICPHDCEDVAELIDTADRRMFEAKSSIVRPPYEVDVTTIVDAQQLLRPDASIEDVPSGSSIVSLSNHAAIRWLFAGAFFLAWAAVPGLEAPNRSALIVLGITEMMLAGVVFVARSSSHNAMVLRISDWATLTSIAPTIWITGGWESPAQLVTFFPVAFYAQFMRGRKALWRVAVVIVGYAVAFWTSGPLGFAGASVDPAAETLFIAIVTAQIVITLILQSNRRATDAAISLIGEAATHDLLTGVLNIHAFRGDLVRAANEAGETAVTNGKPGLVLVDIDEFRQVNVAADHRGGDIVLRDVAARLGIKAANIGNVYRIGCDEFAVLLTDGGDDATEALSARVYEALRFYPAHGPSLPKPVTVSVGHAVWRPHLGAQGLLDEAEQSLTRGKSKPGGEKLSQDGATLL